MGHKSKTAEFIFAHMYCKDASCLLWPYGHDGQGYARAKVEGFGTRLAHRIMCELVNGPPPFDGAVARHLCGMGHEGCVNPQHLAWGTVSDNNKDKIDAGRQPIGEEIGRSVLSPEKVRLIRRLSAQGASQRQIAGQFGVSHGTVQAVIEGRTWSHVQ